MVVKCFFAPFLLQSLDCKHFSCELQVASFEQWLVTRSSWLAAFDNPNRGEGATTVFVVGSLRQALWLVVPFQKFMGRFLIVSESF